MQLFEQTLVLPDTPAHQYAASNAEAECGRCLCLLCDCLVCSAAFPTAGCTMMRLRGLRRPGPRRLMGPAAGGKPAPRSRSSYSGWVPIFCSDLYTLASFTHSAALSPQVMGEIACLMRSRQMLHLQVPAQTPPRDLHVIIEPYALKGAQLHLWQKAQGQTRPWTYLTAC